MPRCFTAFTTLRSLEAATALGDAIERMTPEPVGVGVFEIEDGKGVWEVGGYFLEEPDPAGLALLSTLFGTEPFVVLDVPDTDWVAQVKRELTPVEAGRFFVYGSHDADKVPDNVVALAIEAAMAFGTGHHATTQGCLIGLDRLIDQGFEPNNIIDVGCGTAVLAMAAASVWDVPVIASDIDEVATDTATANISFNKLSDKITVVTAAGFQDGYIKQVAPFDLVFANILKAPLIALAPDMAAFTKEGSKAILSGLLTRQTPEVEAAYGDVGFSVEDRIEIGEWTSLILSR